MMIARRTFLGFAASACCAIPASATVPTIPAQTLSFRVMRKGDRIGTHTLSFSGDPGSPTVDIQVEMAVSFGPIRMFHYNHHNIERWKNGRFDAMSAKTDYDGEPAWCEVHRDSDKLVVEGSKAPRYEAPGTVLAATHWNKAELACGGLINPENGMLLHPAISDLGSTSCALASGRTVASTHYGWQGEQKLDLWYDAENCWTALRAVTSSGEIISYERL